MSQNLITVDDNEATASVASRLSEAIAIFPITPSSPMAELSGCLRTRSIQTNVSITSRVET